MDFSSFPREEIVFDVRLDLALPFPHSFARLGADQGALSAALPNRTAALTSDRSVSALLP